MTPGTRVILDMEPCMSPEGRHADHNNGRDGTVVRSSPDGQWLCVHLDGDAKTNLRNVRPDQVTITAPPAEPPAVLEEVEA